MLKPTHSGVSSHAFISTFASQGFVCPIPQSPTRLMSFPGASWFFTKMYSFPREMQRSSEERKRPFTSAIRSDVNSRARSTKSWRKGGVNSFISPAAFRYSSMMAPKASRELARPRWFRRGS